MDRTDWLLATLTYLVAILTGTVVRELAPGGGTLFSRNVPTLVVVVLTFYLAAQSIVAVRERV